MMIVRDHVGVNVLRKESLMNARMLGTPVADTLMKRSFILKIFIKLNGKIRFGDKSPQVKLTSCIYQKENTQNFTLSWEACSP